LHLLSALVDRPGSGVIRRLVNDDGDVSDQTLLEHASEELDVEHGLVAADLGILEDVERIGPVSGSASVREVLDRVGDVWPEL
jgi:hypothetical protein